MSRGGVSHHGSGMGVDGSGVGVDGSGVGVDGSGVGDHGGGVRQRAVRGGAVATKYVGDEGVGDGDESRDGHDLESHFKF